MTDLNVSLPQHDERPIFDLFSAQMQSRMVEIALRIGMFEALKEPIDVGSLCDRLSINARAAQVLLSVLAACNLLDVSSPKIALSGLAREYLLEDSPFYKGGLFRLIPNEELELLRTVHLREQYPRPMTTRWLAGKVLDPGRQAANMHAHSFAAGSVFARHPLFKDIRKLLDVGGGAGSISIALARHNPHLRCVVLDLPPMEAPAKSLIDKYLLTERLVFHAGDIFKSEWSEGCDAILFSNVFHDWTRAHCELLAEKAFELLPPGGRVFINEMILREARDGPLGAALFSAIMFFQTEGQQLTMSELSHIVSKAGFVNVENLMSFGYYSLITCQKPNAVTLRLSSPSKPTGRASMLSGKIVDSRDFALPS